MRADCPSPWQGYQCDWSVGYLWHSMTWLVSLDVIVLALMLMYVVVVASRDSCLFYLALRQSRAFIRDAAEDLRTGALEEVIALAARSRRSPVATMVASGLTAFLSAPTQITHSDATDAVKRALQRGQRKFVADMHRRLWLLKSIAATAPALGLAGTCLGLLSAFRGIDMERHAATMLLAFTTSSALIPAAVGLLVVVPAIWSYDHLRTCVDQLETEMAVTASQAATHLAALSRNKFPPTDEDTFCETRFHSDRSGRLPLATSLPLRRRIARLPPLVVSVPVWLVLAATFASFTSFRSPVGLSVRLLKPGPCVTESGFSTEPVFIELVKTVKGETTVYVDMEKVASEEFEDAVEKALKKRPQTLTYVLADRVVAWSQVADAIDSAKKQGADVVLLTAAPRKPVKSYAPAPSISSSLSLRSTPQR